MKFLFKITTALVALSLATAVMADENHETIEKVMKKGLKGPSKDEPSAMTNLLEGKLEEAATKELADLVKTMAGTKAPAGDQEAYDKKVNELIAALDAVAGGKKSPEDITRLKDAQNCKACHNDHKPKKE